MLGSVAFSAQQGEIQGRLNIGPGGIGQLQISGLLNLLRDVGAGATIQIEGLADELLTQEAEEKANTPFLLSFGIENKVQITGAAASLGVVAWALNSAGILSSVLATVPAWRNLDPISMLDKDSLNPLGEEEGDEPEDEVSEETAAELLSE